MKSGIGVLAGVAVLCAMLGACMQPERADGEIVMQEHTRWRLPEGETLQRATISDSGEITVLFGSGKIGQMARDGGELTLSSGVPDGVALGLDGDQRAFVLDRAGCSWRVESVGLPERQGCLSGAFALGPVVDGVLTASATWVAVLAGTSHAVVHSGTVVDTILNRRIDSVGSGGENEAPWLVRNMRTGELVAWWRLLPLAAHVHSATRGAAPWTFSIPALSDDESRTWHVLRPVMVGDTWLVTVADLRSDQRVLVRISSSGELLATRQLDTPLGMLAANSVGDALAVSDVEGQELVLYCLSSASDVLLLLVVYASPVRAQNEPLCQQCVITPGEFADCVNAGLGEDGYRTCAPQGPYSCFLNFACMGVLTDAMQVLPSGRIGLARVLVATRSGVSSAISIRTGNSCGGLAFSQAYSATTKRESLLAQRLVVI